MPLLDVAKLSVTLDGATAVTDASFSVERGQRVAIIGESGAGKSILARALSGLLPPGAAVSGSVFFDGQQLLEDESRLAALRGGKLGALLETDRDALDPLLTGIQHLLGVITAHDDTRRQRDVQAWLARVGLDPARARLFPEQLSPAERQSLVVALALAREPELLIADNPARGLDLIDQHRVFDLIERICTEREMALLLISPDIRAIAMLAEKVLVLHQGRIVEAGSKTDVFGHPKHDYTRTVLSAGRLRQRTLMRTPIGEALLTARAVGRKGRGRGSVLFALEGVSFEMRTGESLALFGTGGAGKSLLGRIVAGLERATTGSLEFDARVYRGTDLSPINRGDIGYVFRQARTAFDPKLPVGLSIAEPLRLDLDRGIDDPDSRVRDTVAALGLSPDLLTALPPKLTDAQLQRFAVARALITRPKLVVLDEPVLDLDIGERSAFLILLDRLRADFGLSLLIATRDFDTVRVLADRVLVMDRGHVVETGTPAQLAAAPQHPVTQRLIEALLPEIGIVPIF